MTSTDPWQSVVSSLSTYSKKHNRTVQVLEKKLSVDVVIRKQGKKWVLSISEGKTQSPLWNDFDQLYKAVEWSVKQLETWPNVTRTSYFEWSFKERASADKFKTLFTLQWAQ